MNYFSRKSLSKYLMNTIDFNKHDINIFINDMWQKYTGDIGWLFKITRWLELCFWPTEKQSQSSQGDFFARISLLTGALILNLSAAMSDVTVWVARSGKGSHIINRLMAVFLVSTLLSDYVHSFSFIFCHEFLHLFLLYLFRDIISILTEY